MESCTSTAIVSFFDENGHRFESGDHITVPSNLRAGAAWVSTQFDYKECKKDPDPVEEATGWIFWC